MTQVIRHLLYCVYFSIEIMFEMQNFTKKMNTILTCPLPAIRKKKSIRDQSNTGTVFPERLWKLSSEAFETQLNKITADLISLVVHHCKDSFLQKLN